MNTGYKYKDGNIIPIDNNIEKESIEYQDNIEEILNKENNIEILENELKEIRNKKYNLEKEIKKIKVYPIIIGILISLLLLIDTKTLIIKASMSILEVLKIIFIPIIPCFSAIFTLDSYVEKKIHAKDLNGLTSEIELTKKLLEQEKTNLNKLINNKTKINEFILKNNSTKKIDYKNQLKQLKRELEKYYNIGYYNDKYINYYKEGTLEENINVDNYDIVIEHMKEKVKTLKKENM